jgi:iron(III) transport system substrate-binding protein
MTAHSAPAHRPRRLLGRTCVAGIVGALVVALAACGSAPAADGALAAETGPGGDAAWQKLVEEAKAEAEVVFYGSHAEDTMNALGAAFEKEYGIKVKVFRAPDNDLEPKLDAEKSTGNHVADVVGLSDVSYVKMLSASKQLAEPIGPTLSDAGFDRATNQLADGAFRSAATTMSFAWNTQLVPGGLKDFDGLLDPSLSGGKIGILSPIAPAVMDFYTYLGSRFGDDFLDRLARQKPRLYNSGAAMSAALASGEIAAASQISQVVLADAKDAGAPVETGLADPPWAAPFYESVLAGAPHPKAAQLLMNYIFSRAGQEILAAHIASVRSDVPSAVTTVDKTVTGGKQVIAPAEFKAFSAKFTSTFS